MTLIDWFTWWREVILIKHIEAWTVARVSLQNWVAPFSVPRQLNSDSGNKLESDLWASMSELLGTLLNPTTANHSQSNGLIERLCKTLKASLKAWLISPNWVDELPWVLLGLRTTPKEDLNASPADLVYGSTLRVTGFYPWNRAKPRYRKYPEVTGQDGYPQINPCQHAWGWTLQNQGFQQHWCQPILFL